MLLLLPLGPLLVPLFSSIPLSERGTYLLKYDPDLSRFDPDPAEPEDPLLSFLCKPIVEADMEVLWRGMAELSLAVVGEA